MADDDGNDTNPTDTGDAPFNWTNGNVSAMIGDHFQMTFGESTSATIGLSAGITVGNNFLVVCDPLEMLKGMNFFESFVAPWYRKLVGYQQFNLSPQYTYTVGRNVSLMVNGSDTINLTTATAAGMIYWSQCFSL